MFILFWSKFIHKNVHQISYTFNSLLVLQLFPLWIGLRVGTHGFRGSGRVSKFGPACNSGPELARPCGHSSATCGGSCTGCRSASVSTSSPGQFNPSTRVHPLTLRVSCTDTNHRGQCTLAPLQPCTGLTPLLTSTNIPLLSAPVTWNNIPASIRDSGTLGTFKTALKRHLFNSAYTSCHWQPSIGASGFTRSWLMAPTIEISVIDWLITTFRQACD